MMDTVRIQLTFSEKTIYGTYTDALYFSEDEWASITKAQINEMKNARVSSWVDSVRTASMQSEPEQEND
jgi:hypothetical protein